MNKQRAFSCIASIISSTARDVSGAELEEGSACWIAVNVEATVNNVSEVGLGKADKGTVIGARGDL